MRSCLNNAYINTYISILKPNLETVQKLSLNGRATPKGLNCKWDQSVSLNLS